MLPDPSSYRYDNLKVIMGWKWGLAWRSSDVFVETTVIFAVFTVSLV